MALYYGDQEKCMKGAAEEIEDFNSACGVELTTKNMKEIREQT